MKLNHYTYMFVCFAVLQSVVCFAETILQEKEKTDSLLRLGTRIAYENPNETIQLGLLVFENENNTPKSRLRGLMLVSLGYTSKRDYQKALKYVIKANEFTTTQLNDPILNIELLTRTGILYQQLKIFDKSIEFLDKSEQACLAYPYKDSVSLLLGNTYLVKGFIYKDNLNCDIALGYFEKGIKEYERQSGSAQHNNLSIAHYNKGNCYALLSNYGLAKNSFNRSIELAKTEGANSLVSFAQKGMAEVYTLEGRYQDALELLQQALEQSKNVGDLILNQGIYKGLFENYLALNNWEEYQKYYNQYLSMQVKIQQSERNSVSDSINEDKKNQEEKARHLEIQFRFNQYIIIFGAVLVVFCIVFIEIKNRKSIKKLKNEIEKRYKSKSEVLTK